MSFKEGIVVDGIPVVSGVNEAISKLANDRLIAFDIETSGLSPWRDKIATVQLYGDQSGTLALLHVRGALPKALQFFLSRPDAMWVGHNVVNFDAMFAYTHGVDVNATRYFDTMVAEQVITPHARRDVRHTLKATLNRRLGVELNKDIEHSWMNPVLTDEQVYYAVRDILHLPALMRAQYEVAEKLNQRAALDFEVRLIPAVIQMMTNGMPVDLNALAAYVQVEQEKVNYLSDVIQHGGVVFNEDGNEVISEGVGEVKNLGSTVQLQKALGAIGIHTKSTNELVMMDIKVALVERGMMEKARLIDNIIAYKHARQRVNMYGTKWVEDFAIQHEDGYRVHANHRQCGADTGRFTVSGPNMQQVPSEQAMRSCFVARPGHLIVTADYSGIEVRVAAAIARDKTMLEALKTEDIHTTVAALVFDKAPGDIAKSERKLAKSMNFRLLFGGGVKGFYHHIRMEGSHLTLPETAAIVNKFFTRFRGLNALRQKAYDLARSNNVVWIDLPNGLRRMLAGDKLRPTTILNTPVQGTAGVGLKKAMILLYEEGWGKYLVETVHDELVMEVPEEQAQAAAAALKDCMVRGMEEYVPGVVIKVDVVVGPTWSKA